MHLLFWSIAILLFLICYFYVYVVLRMIGNYCLSRVLLMVINPKACFSKHCSGRLRAFAFVRLESLCCFNPSLDVWDLRIIVISLIDIGFLLLSELVVSICTDCFCLFILVEIVLCLCLLLLDRRQLSSAFFLLR